MAVWDGDLGIPHNFKVCVTQSLAGANSHVSIRLHSRVENDRKVMAGEWYVCRTHRRCRCQLARVHCLTNRDH